MTRKLRQSKRRDHLSLEETLLLALGTEAEFVERYGSLEEARARWEQVGHRIQLASGYRPEAFWIFEGPPELREREEQQLPNDIAGYGTMFAHERAFEQARLRWLREHGLMDPDEELALMPLEGPR